MTRLFHAAAVAAALAWWTNRGIGFELGTTVAIWGLLTAFTFGALTLIDAAKEADQ